MVTVIRSGFGQDAEIRLRECKARGAGARVRVDIERAALHQSKVRRRLYNSARDVADCCQIGRSDCVIRLQITGSVPIKVCVERAISRSPLDHLLGSVAAESKAYSKGVLGLSGVSELQPPRHGIATDVDVAGVGFSLSLDPKVGLRLRQGSGNG